MKSMFVIIPIILIVVVGSGSALYFSSYDDNVINLDMGMAIYLF